MQEMPSQLLLVSLQGLNFFAQSGRPKARSFFWKRVVSAVGVLSDTLRDVLVRSIEPLARPGRG